MPGTLQIVATQRIQKVAKNDCQHTKATAKRIANLNVNRKIAIAPSELTESFHNRQSLGCPNHNNGYDPTAARVTAAQMLLATLLCIERSALKNVCTNFLAALGVSYTVVKSLNCTLLNYICYLKNTYFELLRDSHKRLAIASSDMYRKLGV